MKIRLFSYISRRPLLNVYRSFNSRIPVVLDCLTLQLTHYSTSSRWWSPNSWLNDVRSQKTWNLKNISVITRNAALHITVFTGFGVSIATCFLCRLYDEVPGSTGLPQLLSTYRRPFLPHYLSQQLCLCSVQRTVHPERLYSSENHATECHWLQSKQGRILLYCRLQIYILHTSWFENCRKRCLSQWYVLPREMQQKSVRGLVVSLIKL